MYNCRCLCGRCTNSNHIQKENLSQPFCERILYSFGCSNVPQLASAVRSQAALTSSPQENTTVALNEAHKSFQPNQPAIKLAPHMLEEWRRSHSSDWETEPEHAWAISLLRYIFLHLIFNSCNLGLWEDTVHFPLPECRAETARLERAPAARHRLTPFFELSN